MGLELQALQQEIGGAAPATKMRFIPVLLAAPTSPALQIAQNRDRNSTAPLGSADAMLPPGYWQKKASSSASAVTGQNNSFRDGCGHGRQAPPRHSKLWRGSQPSSLLVRVAVGSPCGQQLVERLIHVAGDVDAVRRAC